MNNKATNGYGGAIYNFGGITTITGTFTNNSGTMGGAISAYTNSWKILFSHPLVQLN